MKFIKRLGVITVPAVFLFAGFGMLILLKVEGSEGSFFYQVKNNEFEWIIAHVILLASTIFILPAALTIRSSIDHNIAGKVSTFFVLVIAVTSILLAGQYSIDFLVPIMIEVGGDALKVNELLFLNPLVNILFYGLPNLVFLSLFFLSVLLVWSKVFPPLSASLLMINWVAVLLGNLIHPAFQRVAILLLSFSYMPLVKTIWKSLKVELNHET